MDRWRELEDDSSRATIIVQKLTSRKEELTQSLPRGTEPMPRSELHFCNGLAFTFVRKVGVGLSFEGGHGFVIRKIYTGDRDGRPQWTWSAPLFLTVAAAGLGLTVGYTEIESVIVLDTAEAVQAFTKSQWSVDTDITGAAGGAMGAHLPATAANMSNMKLSDKTFTYSITKGAILDVSLTGLNYATDPAMNKSFYGNKVTPQAILDGGLEPPEPMRELYAVLDKVLNEYYENVEGEGAVETEVEQAGGGDDEGAGTSAAGAAAGAAAAAAPGEPAPAKSDEGGAAEPEGPADAEISPPAAPHRPRGSARPPSRPPQQQSSSLPPGRRPSDARAPRILALTARQAAAAAMLGHDPPLELDESDLFDEDSGVDMSPAAPTGALAASLHAAAVATARQSAVESESESDDDGIVLESECSSSEAEQDDVEAELVSRIQSLQSSLEGHAVLGDASAGPLGTSHSSQVGSLKSFGGMSFKGKRLFKSDGDLAASMPVHGCTSAPMFAGRRQVAPERQASFTNLGTSMPISIPLLQRRASSNDQVAGGGGDARGGASTFVPPHMLQRQEGEDAFGEALVEPSLGLSPSTGAKRERLLARNAILRSTGFIEVQRAAVIGEVLDPVKEQLLQSSGAVPLAVPGVRADARAPPRSSLTQLLGTSK
ncbi:SH3 domain-containing [Micractinium conductrix]|uniref:SH3 domain-containing n=1 Tax=Micractinium conductrix TaxID=554055 RepID=A0A2P6VKF6_9CHLO|nr:SH3 domain-containing [Micractinium conductrix]|eukprot:PSC74547.1 SH3 domain-containing [Micractinium conductrix]